MKKNIFLVAIAALTLGMVSCQKEDITPIVDNGGEVNTGARVKTTADLIGTNWTYTMDDITFVDGFSGDTITIPSMGDLMNLAFDADYAHFTFTEMVEAWGIGADGMSLEQITGVDYEYSYNGTTHTGSLIGTVEDEDGNEIVASLEFTYDDNTDEITFLLPMSFDGDTANTTNVPMVFHRAE